MTQVLSTLALAAFALGLSTAHATYPIESNWGLTQASNGFVFDMTLSISNNMVNMTNVCTYKGQSASASVSSQAQYDDAHLTILSTVHGTGSNGGLDCNADMKASSMSYVVNGNLLNFTDNATGEKVTFTRK